MSKTRALSGAVAIAIASLSGCDLSTPDEHIVERFCLYRAPSIERLANCLQAADADRIRGREENAARYATGKLERCLRDAGPYCGNPNALYKARELLDSREPDPPDCAPGDRC